MSDLTLQEDPNAVPTVVHDEMRLVKLAREIAMDLHELDDILARHGFTSNQFELLKAHTRFMEILSAEIAAWSGAINTHERVRLKAGAIMEEWLPEAYARMIDPNEDLLKKSKIAELVARMADMGVRGATLGAGDVDRVSITINLGADATHKYDKQVTPKVIEGVAIHTAQPAETADASTD